MPIGIEIPLDEKLVLSQVVGGAYACGLWVVSCEVRDMLCRKETTALTGANRGIRSAPEAKSCGRIASNVQSSLSSHLICDLSCLDSNIIKIFLAQSYRARRRQDSLCNA